MRHQSFVVQAFGIVFTLLLSGCFALKEKQPLRQVRSGADPVLHWNLVMLDINAEDHALTAPDQGGPTRTSRAFAIVQAAVFDSVNAISRRYRPYLVDRSAPGASVDAAVASAAYRTMYVLYPQHRDRLADQYSDFMERTPDTQSFELGITLGRQIADEILSIRESDNADEMTTYDPGADPAPGVHVPDAINPNQGFLHPNWGAVTPFGIQDTASIGVPPPPPLMSDEYADAYMDVMRLGGDGFQTQTFRTLEQTIVGIYWGYDGSPGIGTPPRLFNQIVHRIAEIKGNDVYENARVLALTNIAMADAGIVAWEAKYRYAFWRPISGIRVDIENPFTMADPLWKPLGAPRSNSIGNNFTPNFPAYPSGHATFGASLFKMLANFYGTDDVEFSFVSDELNGETTDNEGNVRPHVVRHFDSFSEAAEENGQSRVYLGVHWEFDKTAGIDAGNAIADYIFQNFMQPL